MRAPGLFLGSSAYISCKPLVSVLAQVPTSLATPLISSLAQVPPSLANPYSLSWLKCLHLLQTLALFLVSSAYIFGKPPDLFLGSIAYIACKPLISFLAEVPTSLSNPWSLSWLKCLHLLQTPELFLGRCLHLLQALISLLAQVPTSDLFLGSSAYISCKPLISFFAQTPVDLLQTPDLFLGSSAHISCKPLIPFFVQVPTSPAAL